MTDLVRQKFKINISGKKVLKLMKEKPCFQQCEETLELLSAERNLEGAVFHTDQGSTYLSPRFKEKIKEAGMIQSCSARGICWDNAAMESANEILKTECLYNKFGKSEYLKSLNL